jgi:hypothetical protein
MQYTKIIETSVDLFDPDEIYTNDLPNLLFKKLSKTFNGHCYSSMLILKVLEIIHYSERYMVDNRLDGACFVNVQFKVEGIVLNNNDILHNCKVSQITNSNIILEHKYATCIMVSDPHRRLLGLIKKDQIVSVIVQNVCYNIYKEKITIMCTPYSPVMNKKQVFYNIINQLNNSENTKLDLLINEYNLELEKHKEISNSKSYTFFKNIMYPYKTIKNFSKVNDLEFKKIEFDKLKKLTNLSCITLPINSEDIYHYNGNLIDENLQIIDSDIYPALSEIIMSKFNYLVALRGFTEVYNTSEKVQDMLPYWKMCNALKE